MNSTVCVKPLNCGSQESEVGVGRLGHGQTGCSLENQNHLSYILPLLPNLHSSSGVLGYSGDLKWFGLSCGKRNQRTEQINMDYKKRVDRTECLFGHNNYNENLVKSLMEIMM